MASFVYYYKTPDNVRHSGEIDAKDRDAAFARLREQGIRAIKVEPKGWETGKGYAGVKRRVVAGVAAACVVFGIVLAVVIQRVAPEAVAPVVPTVGGAADRVLYSLATPLERQRIMGDRMRIENLPTNLFATASESYLARFAEPGRPLAAEAGKTPDADAFTACLKAPVRLASNDFTEHVDLKRIVTGMKREASAYLAGGGTVDGYFAELVKRQKMEIAYRDKAAVHLKELLDGEPATAYAYWLKANASLQAMGIYPLDLPERLRTYQLSLDLDSEDGVPMLTERAVESPPVSVPKK